MTRHALEHTTNGGVKIVAALLQLPWLHHAWVFWVESSFGAITLMLLLKECMCVKSSLVATPCMKLFG